MGGGGDTCSQGGARDEVARPHTTTILASHAIGVAEVLEGAIIAKAGGRRVPLGHVAGDFVAAVIQDLAISFDQEIAEVVFPDRQVRPCALATGDERHDHGQWLVGHAARLAHMLRAHKRFKTPLDRPQ